MWYISVVISFWLRHITWWQVWRWGALISWVSDFLVVNFICCSLSLFPSCNEWSLFWIRGPYVWRHVISCLGRKQLPYIRCVQPWQDRLLFDWERLSAEIPSSSSSTTSLLLKRYNINSKVFKVWNQHMWNPFFHACIYLPMLYFVYTMFTIHDDHLSKNKLNLHGI